MKQKEIVVIGGGGHTRVLIGVAAALALPVKGIITRNAQLIGTSIHAVAVLGLEESCALNPDEVTLLNGVGNAANSKGTGLEVRSGIYTRYTAQGFSFLTLVSPNAMVQPLATLHTGAQVMAGAVIQAGCVVGENSIINTRVTIDHDCHIGKHCHIAPGAVLCGDVVVGAASHIGAGAIITQGVRIGSNVVIGAGALVTRDVPDGMLLRPVASECVPLSHALQA